MFWVWCWTHLVPSGNDIVSWAIICTAQWINDFLCLVVPKSAVLLLASLHGGLYLDITFTLLKMQAFNMHLSEGQIVLIYLLAHMFIIHCNNSPEQFTVKAHPALFEGRGRRRSQKEGLLFQSTIDIHILNIYSSLQLTYMTAALICAALLSAVTKTVKACTLCVY